MNRASALTSLILGTFVVMCSAHVALAQKTTMSFPTAPLGGKVHGDVIRFQPNQEAIENKQLTVTFPVTIDTKQDYTLAVDFTAVDADIASGEFAKDGDIKSTVSIEIPDNFWNRPITLRVTANYVHTNSNLSFSVKTDVRIHIDTEGPHILQPLQAEYFPGSGGNVYVNFKSDDLDSKTVTKSRITAKLTKTQGQDVADVNVQYEGDPEIDKTGRQVKLSFKSLNAGTYELTIASGVVDVVGNPIDDESQTVTFEIASGSQRGHQVEFPRFLQPGNVQSEFVPGDLVDTRTINLYYFRDARRVAEIINRNVRALNQTGYDEAQRFAREARIDAEAAVDDRRYQETLAIDAAQRTREMQNRAQELQQQLNAAVAAGDELLLEQQQTQAVVAVTVGTSPLTETTANGSDLPESAGNTPAQEAQESLTTSSLETAIDITRGQITTIQGKIRDAQNQLAVENQTRIATELLQAQTAFKIREQELDSATASDNSDGMRQERIDAATTNLAAAEEALVAAQGKQLKIDQAKANLPGLEGQLANETNKLQTLLTLRTRNALNQARKNRNDELITTTKNELTSIGAQLSDIQNKEINSRNDLLKREANELRTAQEKFRREVIAGLTDPDVFVAGKVESIDPVTQVSITVVGTSRLQLRGPIKGINKIARIVHQLDSPVGQVKIGIHTVQVNGEHGDRMDFVYERILREIQHSRFLTNQSGGLLRRAVHEVAAEVALAADNGYCPVGAPVDLTTVTLDIDGNHFPMSQEERDRRYLYAFFGSDFIRELEAMDSELLNTENKMLSLHSMDTVSLAGALSVTSLADHPVRMRILQRFQELVATELPMKEEEYVRALTQVTKRGNPITRSFRKAFQIDAKEASDIYFNAARTYNFSNSVTFFNHQIPGQGTLNPVQYATIKMAQTLKAQLIAELEYKNLVLERSLLETKPYEIEDDYKNKYEASQWALRQRELEIRRIMEALLTSITSSIESFRTQLLNVQPSEGPFTDNDIDLAIASLNANKDEQVLIRIQPAIAQLALSVTQLSVEEFDHQLRVTFVNQLQFPQRGSPANEIVVNSVTAALLKPNSDILKSFRDRLVGIRELQIESERLERLMKDAEAKLFSKRLLEQFMDEQEEKSVELMEALRAHSSNVDNYLKRVATALEDDVAAQFYEPAFQRIRRVSRSWDVTLGQIETTTILTNNRTLAKVDPAATFEFDLPPRDILINEAFDGMQAVAKDYGNLLNDPTFLAGTALLSTNPATGVVGDNAPMQSAPGFPDNRKFGSNLEQLIPDPAIYKFETGTGFEIQPVIQPDGNSIVYTFDYLYSTNVREPVRADEKHLGRIKRHFIHTDVQTSSYELREISRYTVALKASRTSRGVPGLEDLPGVGGLFRPLPSDESSLQTNIIMGSSVIYPTMFDLMGLRWSHYVDDISSSELVNQKGVQSVRRNDLRSRLLETTRTHVNERIGLPQQRPVDVIRVPTGYPTRGY